VTLPLVEELVPAPDPVEACARFLGAPYLCFLDSTAADPRLGHHSFLSADPVTVLRTPGEPDPIGTARALLASHGVDPVPGLPPFQGGIAGYLGYDWGAELERVARPTGGTLAIPDVVLGLYDWVIAWDHLLETAWIVSTGLPETGPRRKRRRRRRKSPLASAPPPAE